MADPKNEIFPQLPAEIRKAIDAGIADKVRGMVDGFKAGNVTDAETLSTTRLALSDPVKFKQLFESSVAGHTGAVESDVTRFALDLLEGKKKTELNVASRPPMTAELTGTVNYVAEQITQLAASGFASGEDKSDLARHAAQASQGNPQELEAFKKSIATSLINNPETIELMKELPEAMRTINKKAPARVIVE